MSCKKCNETEGIAYYRVGKANIGLIGCDEHLNEVMRAIDGRKEDRPVMRMMEPPKTMNTPDTEKYELGIEHSTGANSTRLLKDNTPDTEEWEEKVKAEWSEYDNGVFRSLHSTIDFIESLLSSRDTYWKERVRKEIDICEDVLKGSAGSKSEIEGAFWHLRNNLLTK